MGCSTVTLMRIPPYQGRYGINLQSDSHHTTNYKKYIYFHTGVHEMVMIFHSVENHFWLYPIHRFTHYQLKNVHIVGKVTRKTHQNAGLSIKIPILLMAKNKKCLVRRPNYRKTYIYIYNIRIRYAYIFQYISYLY